MANSFEQLLLEEMLEEDDDYLYDDFSFIDTLIDPEEEEKIFASEDEDIDEEDINLEELEDEEDA